MALIIKNKDLREARLTAEEMKLEIGILMYQQDRLSLGKASAFASMNRIEFMRELGKRKVPVNYDIEELEKDLLTLGINLDDSSK